MAKVVVYELKVEDTKENEWKEAMLAIFPNPPTSGVNDNQWIKKQINDHLKEWYRSGRRALFNRTNQPTID